MNQQRWDRIKELLDSATELPPERRAPFLAAACGDDNSIRAEVEGLLQHHELADAFLSGNAAAGLCEVHAAGTDPKFLPGEAISGRFRIVNFIGRGGMGEVYKAEDSRLRRLVALKFLPDDVARNPDALGRFQREAQTASALNHPNICTIYDISEHNGRAFIAMEFLEGQTLKNTIASGPLDVQRMIEMSIAMADALVAAHTRGIIHRDIKPENIFITSRDDLKILDFGLAKLHRSDTAATAEATISETATLTRKGVTMGTVAYMSPEQARGEPLDARTDLFSFGLVMYEMTTGRRAFPGSTSATVFASLLKDTPQAPSEISGAIPPDLDRIIIKVLEKDRDLRYQSAAELRTDLRRLNRDLESGTISTTARIKRQRATRRHIWMYASMAAVLAFFGLIDVYKFREPAAVATSEWLQITDFTDSAVQPSLSADGRMLTFLRGPETFVTAGQIYVKFLPDGQPVALTHDDRNKLGPVFSPDGSRIAYTVLEGFNWSTYEIPVTGGEPKLLFPNATGLSWIDNNRLLFSEIREGIHMGVVTATPLRSDEHDVYFPADLRGMAHRSYVSPDKQWVVLVEMQTPVWLRCRLVALDGSSPGRQIGPDGSCDSAAWSPDGKWIYLTSDNGGSVTHIWRVRFPDGPPEQITSGPIGQSGVVVAPDGKSLITSVGTIQSTIWLHDENGDRQISSEGFAYFPYINRKGTWLTYLEQDRRKIGNEKSGQQTETRLMRVDLQTGTSQEIFSGPDVGDYCMAPEGTDLLYAVRDRNNNDNNNNKVHIWSAPLNHGRPPKQVTPADTDDYNIMCTDEGDVLFSRSEGGMTLLYRMKPDGSGMQKAFPTPVLDVIGTSADGNWMAAHVDSGKPNTTRVMIYNLRDRAAKQICDTCNPLWSPDSKRLYISFAQVTKGDSKDRGQTYLLPWTSDSNLQVLPPEGTRTEAEVAKIATLVPAARTVQEFAPGPTRKVYAFSRRTTQRNLYRIPLA